MLGIGLGLNKLRSSGLANYLAGAMVWGFKSKFKWNQTSTDIWGFANPNDIDPEAQAVYNRIIADGGVSNLIRLNYFVVGLKTIYGDLANVPVCYDAHWIGYKLGSGTGATAGQAAAKLYSLTVAGDAVQTTAASQPLLLAHNGASSDNYWWGSGVNGNFASTPSASANQITGDIEIISYINLPNPTSYNNIVTKDDAISNRIFIFSLGSNVLSFSTNFGAGLVTYSSTISLPSSVNRWIRVTRNSSNGEIKFFYSADVVTTNPNSVTWIQLGTTVSGTVGASVTGTSIVAIGAQTSAGVNAVQGRIYRATISNSIGGTPVVDFNPATYNASTSQTAWTSATGEVWTINTGTAATGYKGVLVDRTIVQSDGVDDFVQNATVLRGDVCSQYLAYKTENASASGYPFIDSSSGIYLNSFSPEGANMKLYMNGSVSGLQKTLGTTLALFTATNNQGVLNTLQKNNDTQISNTYTPALSGTGVTIGKSGTGFFYQKGNINTYICITGVDNSTVRTAMYNLIRSLNNNAF